MKNLKFTVTAATAAVLLVADASAGDSPRWGGTNENNMVTSEKNLPLDFDGGKKKRGTDEIDMATTKNAKYVIKVGSSTYGTPTIGGGKVLVGTNNESPRNPGIIGDRGVVMCFDEESSKFIWQLTVPKLGAGKVSDWEYLGMCSSATIDGDRCYIVTNRCQAVCLDMKGMADGNDGPFKDEGQYMADEGKPAVEVGPTDADIIWVYDMREELGVFPHNVASSSILKIGDDVFVTTSNGVDWTHTNIPIPDAPCLIKLDAKTGELKGEEGAGIGNRIMHCNWSSPTQGMIDGKPVVIFGAGDGFCYCFSTEAEKDDEGFEILKMLWKIDCNPPEYRKTEDGKPVKYATYEGPSEIISSPVVYKDKVYACIGQDPEHGEGVGMMSCIDIKTGKRLWEYKGMERSISTPSIVDDIVYVTDYRGQVHALDANTGESYWVFDTKSHIWSSTLVGDGKVYVPNEDGEIIILATGKEMKEIGRVEFSAPIYSSAVAANETLFVATMTHLYAFKKGAETAAK